MWWVMFGVWCVGVTVLSSIPGTSLGGMDFNHADKVVHFGLFFVGAFFLTAAMRSSFKWTPWVMIPVVSGAMSLLGVLDEWHQLYTPMRTGADLGDWIADSLGGIGGAIAVYAVYGFFRLFVRPQPDPIAPATN